MALNYNTSCNRIALKASSSFWAYLKLQNFQLVCAFLSKKQRTTATVAATVKLSPHQQLTNGPGRMADESLTTVFSADFSPPFQRIFFLIMDRRSFLNAEVF